MTNFIAGNSNNALAALCLLALVEYHSYKAMLPCMVLCRSFHVCLSCVTQLYFVVFLKFLIASSMSLWVCMGDLFNQLSISDYLKKKQERKEIHQDYVKTKSLLKKFCDFSKSKIVCGELWKHSIRCHSVASGVAFG